MEGVTKGIIGRIVLNKCPKTLLRLIKNPFDLDSNPVQEYYDMIIGRIVQNKCPKTLLIIIKHLFDLDSNLVQSTMTWKDGSLLSITFMLELNWCLTKAGASPINSMKIRVNKINSYAFFSE